MKTLVIAGTYEQAQLWIKNDLAKRSVLGETTLSQSEYIVVHNVDQLLGLRDPHGVFVGTWKTRADINEIVDVLYARTKSKNHSLEKVYHELTKQDELVGNSPQQEMIDKLREIMVRNIDETVLKRIGM